MATTHYITKVLEGLNIAREQILQVANTADTDRMARTLGVTKSAFNNKTKGRRTYTIEQLLVLAHNLRYPKAQKYIEAYMYVRENYAAALGTLPIPTRVIAQLAAMPYYDYNRRGHKPLTWTPDELKQVEAAISKLHDTFHTFQTSTFPALVKRIKKPDSSSLARKELVDKLDELPILNKEIAFRAQMPYYHYVRRSQTPDSLTVDELTRIGHAIKLITTLLDDFLEKPLVTLTGLIPESYTYQIPQQRGEQTHLQDKNEG